MEWATLPLKKYAEFTGRSRRKEYWMYVLLLIVVSVVLGVVEGILGINQMIAGMYGPLSLLFSLATLCPSIAVGIRRLHDINRSGWWLLIAYAPLALAMVAMLLGLVGLGTAMALLGLAGIGALVLFVFSLLEGTRGPNQYGPDPKGADLETTFA